MAAFLDVCRFTPTLGGTTDWTVSAAVTGYQTPASAGAVNGTVYRYRAESADLSQWEVGYGPYTVAGTVLARTTVLFNSSGTTSKISFTVAPQVAVVALKEDLISITEANSFTTTEKKQVQSNILVAPTVQSFLSGSGTYTTPTGCTRIRVRMVGGGGGGFPSGTSGGAPTAGGNTTFGTSLLVANGGAAGTNITTAATGGTASGGDINVSGQNGISASNANGDGGIGGNSAFGGAGSPVFAGAGTAAASNSGSGGGGGWFSGTGSAATGGAAAGYCEKLITSPLATYSYAVGAAGTGGTAGTSGTAGANGGAGAIYIEEYYGS